MTAYFDAFRRYFDFSGRSTPSQYWLFMLFYAIILIVALTLDLALETDPTGETQIIAGLAALVHLIPSLAVTVRRLHDTDRSGWFILIGIVPIIGQIALLVFLCSRSTGPNRYDAWAANMHRQPAAAAPPAGNGGDDDRIAFANTPESGPGQPVATSARAESQASVEFTPEKKGSGGKWALGAVVASGLFWLFLASSVETDIAQYDCEMAASLVEGESLQNLFGAQFEIIKVSSLNQVSKTDKKIVCTGLVDHSFGQERMRITVESGSNAAEVLFRVEPL